MIILYEKNVRIALLYMNLENDVYMTQSDGFEDPKILRKYACLRNLYMN